MFGDFAKLIPWPALGSGPTSQRVLGWRTCALLILAIFFSAEDSYAEKSWRAVSEKLSNLGAVGTADFDQSGHFLMTSNRWGNHLLWDLKAQRLRQTFPGTIASISPNGELIAAGHANPFDYTGKLQIWHISSGELRFSKPTTAVQATAFNRDGSLIFVGGFEGEIWAWNTATGELVHEFKVSRGIRQIAVTRDSETLIVAGSQKILAIDLTTNKQRWRLPKGVFQFILDRSSSRALIKEWSDGLSVLDLVTGLEISRIPVDRGDMSQFAFARNGEFVATTNSPSTDNQISLWDANSGELQTRLHKRSKPIMAIAISPDDSRIIASYRDRQLHEWDLKSPGLRKRTPSFSRCSKLTFDNDGSHIACSSSQELSIWNAETMGREAKLTGLRSRQIDLQLSANGHVLTTTRTNQTRVWRFSPAAEPFEVDGSLTALTDDGSLVVTAGEGCAGRARVWHVSDHKLLRELRHPHPITAITTAPSGELIATGSSEGMLRLWGDQGETLLRELRGSRSIVRHLQISADQSVLAVGYESGLVQVWDLTQNNAPKEFEAERSYGRRPLDLDPTGRFLIAGNISYLSAKVEFLNKTQNSLTLRGNFSHQLNGSAIIPHSNAVALSLSSNEPPGVWDLGNGQKSFALEGHEGGIEDIVVNASGSKITTVSRDQTARIWSTTDGRLLRTLEGSTSRLQFVAVAQDGNLVAAASQDGTVYLWDGKTGAGIVRIFDLEDGQWAALTPEGHWDGSDQGDLDGMGIWQGNRVTTLASSPHLHKPGLLTIVPREGTKAEIPAVSPLWSPEPSLPRSPSNLEQGHELTWVGKIEASLSKLQVAGNHLYGAWRGGWLVIYDLNDPTNPRLVGRVETNDRITELEVHGNIVYALTIAELHKIDVSNPENPRIIWTVKDSKRIFQGFTISGDWAFVSRYLRQPVAISLSITPPKDIEDVTDSPQTASKTVHYDLQAHGSQVIAVGSKHGGTGGVLQVFDHLSPGVLSLRSSLQLPYPAFLQAAENDRVFLASRERGLLVVDASQPDHPRLESTFQSPWASSVAARQDRIYLSDHHLGLVALQPQKRDEPDLVDQISGSREGQPAWALSVALYNDYAYVSSRDAGLWIIRLGEKKTSPLSTSTGESP